MLLASIPHTLTVACDDRHDFQTKLAQMVGEVLSAHVVDWEKQVMDCKAATDAAAQKSTEKINMVEASTAMIELQKEKINTSKDIVKTDSEAVAAAESTKGSAKKAIADFGVECLNKIADKKCCASVYDECLAENSDAKPKGALHNLESAMEKFHMEASLRTAIIPALKKAPAARGSFDQMAIQEVNEVFKKHLNTLQQEIDKIDDVKAERVAAETAAHEAVSVAAEKLEASKAELKSAKAELASLQRKHQELEKIASEAKHAWQKALTHQAKKEQGLENAKDVLDVYTKLLESPQ
jgi:hypothetical protein